MHRVHGRAQHYAWGDPAAIPEMLGEAADGRPWAEWWMGTHPMAPSTIEDGSSLQSVAGELPYLLKLLAAAHALSLQTHPGRRRAAEGFEREEQLGVPRDSPKRLYRDPFAKPELLCALTPFDTLCGFRPVDDTVSLLHEIDAHDLAVFLQHEKLGITVAALYGGQFDLTSTIAACARHDRAEAGLVTKLVDAYPGDPSVVVTLLLNRVVLERGEAVFLGPGNLHAYLHGFGVEIMGSSDNVVRGGLTVKHVDVEELLDVLDFEPLNDPVVRPVEVEPGRWRYNSPQSPFVLWRFELADGQSNTHRAAGRELLLWVDGHHRGECQYLAPGESVELDGPATVFRVEEAGVW
ncbi:MAG: mannose-6-phosphate isomerase, class I [Actinomycetota bacterium]|nr:mannose-6-phosphate isomerase, class I [Actinomycetota bacterium]